MHETVGANTLCPSSLKEAQQKVKAVIVKDSEGNSNLEFSKYFWRKIDKFLYGSRRNKTSILWSQPNTFSEYSKIFHCNFLSSKSLPHLLQGKKNWKNWNQHSPITTLHN